jgi:hypothetical protein
VTTSPSADRAGARSGAKSRDRGRPLVAGVVALPFVAFVLVSIAVWTGRATTGRDPIAAAFAVLPLFVAGVTFAVSASRGNALRRRLAPALVAACAATALIWGGLLVALVA